MCSPSHARAYVISFHPTNGRIIEEKGKNIERLWKEHKFIEAEHICQEIYNYIPKNPLDLFELDFGSFSNWIRSRFVSRNPKPAEYSEENRSKVFLVHGRNIMAKKAMIEFLNSINIEVLEWTAIIAATQNPNAFLHEIIRKGFELAQAVVVLMTPDDIGNLREELCSESEDLDEVE